MPAELLTWTSWALAALWVAITVTRLADIRSVRELPPTGTAPGDAGGLPPRVTVVVTARDEEARIEKAVRGWLAQTGVEAQVVAVDDRSTDRTPEVLAGLAEENPALEVVRVDTLPAGWLGKPHACFRGAERAGGEWILFTDGDVEPSPSVLARALRLAEIEEADHVCLFPRESETTRAVRAAVILFWLAFVVFAARANRDRRFSFVGVGAFNLVRARAYRSVGGHEPLRYEIIDDLKLGLLLKRGGYRSRAGGAPEDLVVRWAPSVPGIVRALEKNAFALYDFSLWKAGLALALVAGLHVATLAGILNGGAAGLTLLAAAASLLIPARIVARRAGWGWPETLLTPGMGVVMLLTLAWSAAATLRRGGVVWRGTLYPLSHLRRGLVRFW